MYFNSDFVGYYGRSYIYIPKKYGLAAVVFIVDNISIVIHYGLYIYIYITNW